MNLPNQSNLNIAVVGAGISGICAAYLLQKRHKVSLFEQNAYFGGHTHTVMIPDGPDKGTPVDTGFIVFNGRTYPNFITFLDRLGVNKRLTEMSFGYYCKKTGQSYATRNINSIFARRLNLINPRYWRFVFEMITFLNSLRRDYLNNHLAEATLSEYVEAKGLHQDVVEQFIIPMAAAIWSGSDMQMGRFPIRTFAQFYENHGLLSVSGHPPWYVVEGGSHTYVKAFLKSFKGRAVKGCKVDTIHRDEKMITLYFKDRNPETFDAVVVAVHADQALSLLEKPNRKEKELLGAWTYSRNHTVLHTDTRVMPPNRRAWASWNYTRSSHSSAASPVTVSYDMNRLQKLTTTHPYFVTLNPITPIAPGHVTGEFEYTHPQYSFDAFVSQEDLALLNGKQNTFFCGSYFGFGFHEDGVRSALEVGKKFGVEL